MTVGAIKPRKGHDIVLNALSKLIKERNDFHYLIVGNNEKRNDYVNRLDSIISDNGLTDNVTFTGSISDDDMPRYFSAIDIYIHTPVMINWNFEGFGIVYLEAGASRKPVIASNSGGTLDAVIPDKTGLVVKEGDIDETYNAIKRLLDNKNLRESLGQSGFLYAKEHTWDNIGNKFIKQYENVLNKKSKDKI
jgi:glycosyltransferase involved in cell wall biosynthesis